MSGQTHAVCLGGLSLQPTSSLGARGGFDLIGEAIPMWSDSLSIVTVPPVRASPVALSQGLVAGICALSTGEGGGQCD